MKPFDSKDFSTTYQGKQINLYTIVSKDLTVTVHNYGAIIVQLLFKGKDLILGYDSIQKYLTSEEKYFSTMVGPVCNRICPPNTMIDGQFYEFKQGLLILHGDSLLSNCVWDVTEATEQYIVMTKTLDNALNFPGRVQYNVKYSVENNVFKIEITAVSDKTTILNCTSHPYFNFGDQNILNHTLQINAEKYLQIDENCVACRYDDVQSTPFDFRNSKKIGQDIANNNEQLKIGLGYDHNFCVQPDTEQAIFSYQDIQMSVKSNQPGFHVYTGGQLTTSNKCHTGKYGIVYQPSQGVCLLSQNYPNACNQPTFPSIEVKAGDQYINSTEYTFE